MMSFPATIVLFIAFFLLFFFYKKIGHYVIPGSQSTVKSQISEMLSNTLLPSINCTVGQHGQIKTACMRQSLIKAYR